MAERIEDFLELVGQIASRAGLTAIFTSGPTPETSDFVIYLEPELVNELVRVRYVRGEKLPRLIEINPKTRRMLEERWGLIEHE